MNKALDATPRTEKPSAGGNAAPGNGRIQFNPPHRMRPSKHAGRVPCENKYWQVGWGSGNTIVMVKYP